MFAQFLLWSLILIVLGGLLAAVPKLLFGGGVLARPRGWRGLLDELGGYVHDTAMAGWTELTNIKATIGTWTITAASNVWSLDHSTADNTSVLHIPIMLPKNSVALKGSYLKSIDLWYFCGTADADDITPVIQKLTLPAHAGAIPSVSSPAFTYDSNHDTAAKRYAHATTMHKMTLTITTPFWIDDDDEVYVELTWNSSATSVDKIYGVRANYTLRI